MNTKQITFIGDRHPGLTSGTYTVAVEQRVSVNGGERYAAIRHFQVRGERFRVTDAEIHSVFPSEKSTGPYRGCLPYVMFDRALLPWLRSLTTDSPNKATWLAVFTFDPDEMPKLVTRTVRDLVTQGVTIRVPASGGASDVGTGTLPSGTLSYPFDPPWDSGHCLLEYGESPDNDVITIDVPVALFKAVAPSLSDMGFLSHVREVDLTGRSAGAGTGGAPPAGEGDGLDVGQFATVLGNRMLAAGPGKAVLVSLEGLGDHLADGDKAPDLGSYSYLRLVVLKTWSFDTLDVAESILRHALDHLCDAPDGDSLISHLRIPAMIPTAAEVADALTAQAAGTPRPAQADILVRHALASGYVPLGHHLRTGGRDVSWYRGPMTPVPVTALLSVPLDSSDAALAYNPETGLFDVSYAAAWQLGQMLALADAGFSAAIYGWQRAVVEQAAASDDRVSISVEHLQRLAVRPSGTQEAAAADPAALFARILGGRLARYARYRTRAAVDGPPDTVTDWLERIKTLKGVPMRYLIPDAQMLRPESLRFFTLDINWVNALLDGACSIARSVSGVSVTPTPWLYSADSLGKVSGCLLNSGVVLGWPGLRISAWAGQTELERIYDDSLVPGLRLLMFDGDLDRLEITEGGECLHFGVDIDVMPARVALRHLKGDAVGRVITADGFSRNAARLRVAHFYRADGGWQSQGQIEGDPPPITVAAVTRGSDGRVIDISATAEAIRVGLVGQGEIAAEGTFTSAELALELVKPVTHVSYQLDR
jgi:hypothetical protein